MKNLPVYLRTLIILFFSIPYLAVLMNYVMLFITHNNYLNGVDNVLFSYFQDSTYLLFIQFGERLCFLLIGILSTEIIFTTSQNYLNHLQCSILVGFIIGVILSYFKVNLFANHYFIAIETILFYAVIGYIYSFFLNFLKIYKKTV